MQPSVVVVVIVVTYNRRVFGCVCLDVCLIRIGRDAPQKLTFVLSYISLFNYISGYPYGDYWQHGTTGRES